MKNFNFKDKKFVRFDEFKSAWKKEAPEVHLLICDCKYKESTRLIFKYKDKKLVYYLKYKVAEKMLMQSCICYLMDLLVREWRPYE